VRHYTRKRLAAKRKKSRRAGILIPAALTACIMSSALYMIFFTENFTLREIRILGSRNANTDSFEAITSGFIGCNTITVSLSKLEEKLKSIPSVKGVEFRRRPFHRIDCYLKNREPVALIGLDDTTGDRMLEIDTEGVIIPGGGGLSDIDLPVITGIGESEIDSPEGRKSISYALEALRLLKVFGFSPAEQLSEIHIEEGGIVLVWMKGGALIRMGKGDYPEKVRKLRAVYRSLGMQEGKPKLIDLRFEQQVVVRLI